MEDASWLKKIEKNDQSEENSLSMYIITVILGRDQNDSPEMTRDYRGDVHSTEQTALLTDTPLILVAREKRNRDFD